MKYLLAALLVLAACSPSDKDDDKQPTERTFSFVDGNVTFETLGPVPEGLSLEAEKAKAQAGVKTSGH